VELSALYVDVLKDRLYCDAPANPRRRAAQTVMHRVLDGLIRLLAPVLAFTAEEAFGFLGGTSSVHLELFPAENAATVGEATIARWKPILELRSRVNENLEEARRAKKIGKSLEAHVIIAGIDPAAFGESAETLAELFIVSQVEFQTGGDAETIIVSRAEEHGHGKCIRCWRFYPAKELGTVPEHPELCTRCSEAVALFPA
jgi:isoleucyl-tRNA synthetase